MAPVLLPRACGHIRQRAPSSPCPHPRSSHGYRGCSVPLSLAGALGCARGVGPSAASPPAHPGGPGRPLSSTLSLDDAKHRQDLSPGHAQTSVLIAGISTKSPGLSLTSGSARRFHASPKGVFPLCFLNTVDGERRDKRYVRFINNI